MTFRVYLLAALVSIGAICLLPGADPSQSDLRKQAQADFKAGNFRDAWKLYRKLALDPRDDDRLVGSDLTAGIDCLRRLAREDEIDSFREASIGIHAKNWRLLQAAADSFVRGTQYGFLIAGQFLRGDHRGGELVSSFERDRVRALQLMQQAMHFLKSELDHEAIGSFYLDLAVQIRDGRNGADAWKLQALTDLSKLPDYEPRGSSGWTRFGGGQTAGAPVDADGNPVFYHLPTRYESAKSDGERWRSALSQAAEVSPAQKYPAMREFANFLHEQFGVQTLLSAGHDR